MQNRLNRPSIEKYSIAYTRKLADAFFGRQETIRGPQILALSHVPQVNFLIIKNLLQRWKKEADKLQSPYFDYDAGEVKQALQNFMNALSQNISIRRNNFEPLLKKSVRDAMILIFSPYDFYSREINHSEKNSISLQELKEVSKYIKVNRQLLEALISRFERDDIDEIFNDEAFTLLNEIAEERVEVEPYDLHLQKFSETLPLSIDMVYQGALPKRAGEERSLKKEEPDAPVPEDDFVFDMTTPEKGPAPSPQQESAAPENRKSLNDNFFKEQTTLNDKLSGSSHQSLSEIHQKQKIESIKQHITLNQKFMFINALFSGNKEAFSAALDKLERCASYSEAMQVLNHDYINKYNWNMAKEEVKDFIDVVSKKYSNA